MSQVVSEVSGVDRLYKVASNPDLDLKTLLSAATVYPRVVLQNPAFTLGLLVNRQPLEKLITPEQLAALVRFPEAPDLLIQHALAAKITKVNDALLANPRLPNVTTTQLRKSYSFTIDPHGVQSNHHHIGGFTWDKRPTLTILREVITTHLSKLLSLQFERTVKEAFAGLNLSNPLVVNTALDAVVEKWTPVAFLQLPFTPPEVLEKFAADDRLARYHPELAAHPHLPPTALKKLAASPDVEVRAAVAQHPTCPPEVRQEFLNSGDPTTLERLAANPRLSVDDQWQLFKVGDRVRQFLAVNPNLATEVEEKLAVAGSAEVHRQLLHRKQLTDYTLRAIRDSEDVLVRYAAENWTPKPVEPQQPGDHLVSLYSKIINSDTFHLAFVAATCTNAPAELLEFLSGSHIPLVRLAVAAHPSTPRGARELLRIDPDRRVEKAAREEPQPLE